MNRDRLLKVIEAVEATPDDAFDMSVWAQKTECGTVGCAVGNYIMRNPECGMRLEFPNDRDGFAVISDSLAQSDDDFFFIAARHFDIGVNEAELLFDPMFYRVYQDEDELTRQHVIDRIRRFIGEPAEVVVEHKAERPVRQTVVTR